ncbi:MAG: hypothetical protein Fur0012_11870 [Elusimicrobiota bacterium]
MKEVESRNPEIGFMINQKEGVHSKITRSYMPLNPSLEFERMDIGGMEEKSFYIKQSFENPLKLNLYKNLSVSDYRISDYEYQSVKNRILRESEVLYYEYLFVLKKRAIYLKMLELVDMISSIAKSRYVSNPEAKDILKAEIEYSQINEELKVLALKEHNLIDELRSYAGGYSVFLSSLAFQKPDFNYEYDKLVSRLNLNPELLYAKTIIENQKLNIKLAGYRYLPDFMLGYRKRYDGSDSHDIIIGFEVPIFFNKNRSYVLESEFLKKAYEKKYEAIRLDKEFLLKKYFLESKTNYELLNYYLSVLIPKSEADLNITISSYQKGDGDISEVLYSFEKYLEIQMKYWVYFFDFYKSMAFLNEVVGRSL